MDYYQFVTKAFSRRYLKLITSNQHVKKIPRNDLSKKDSKNGFKVQIITLNLKGETK